MAVIDHKARVRLEVRNEPLSPSNQFIEQSLPLSLGLEKFDNFTAKLAGISLAINVVHALLEHSDSGKRGAPCSIGISWPLNPVQTTGLQAAIYLRQQYADTLTPELDR